MSSLRSWALFCEDVRIEHDNKFSLVGVIPTVGIGSEPFRFRQLCLVYSIELPISVEYVTVSHEILVTGDVKGLTLNFLKESSKLVQPDKNANEDIWQVITYLTTENVEIKGEAMISAKITVGDEEILSDIRFYQVPLEDRISTE